MVSMLLRAVASQVRVGGPAVSAASELNSLPRPLIHPLSGRFKRVSQVDGSKRVLGAFTVRGRHKMIDSIIHDTSCGYQQVEKLMCYHLTCLARYAGLSAAVSPPSTHAALFAATIVSSSTCIARWP